MTPLVPRRPRTSKPKKVAPWSQSTNHTVAPSPSIGKTTKSRWSDPLYAFVQEHALHTVKVRNTKPRIVPTAAMAPPFSNEFRDRIGKEWTTAKLDFEEIHYTFCLLKPGLANVDVKRRLTEYNSHCRHVDAIGTDLGGVGPEYVEKTLDAAQLLVVAFTSSTSLQSPLAHERILTQQPYLLGFTLLSIIDYKTLAAEPYNELLRKPRAQFLQRTSSTPSHTPSEDESVLYTHITCTSLGEGRALFERWTEPTWRKQLSTWLRPSHVPYRIQALNAIDLAYKYYVRTGWLRTVDGMHLYPLLKLKRSTIDADNVAPLMSDSLTRSVGNLVYVYTVGPKLAHVLEKLYKKYPDFRVTPGYTSNPRLNPFLFTKWLLPWAPSSANSRA